VQSPERRRLAIFGAIVVLALHAFALPKPLRQGSTKGHRHITLSESVLGNVAPDFSMVETSLVAKAQKENVITNRNRTYEAFTVSGTRLFVVERRTKKNFEIHGLPLEWRPFSDLVWKNRYLLVFDRWSQPHYGVHYVVDVKSKRLVTAATFPDEVYLEQQRPKH